jgi:hypothetical protein
VLGLRRANAATQGVESAVSGPSHRTRGRDRDTWAHIARSGVILRTSGRTERAWGCPISHVPYPRPATATDRRFAAWPKSPDVSCACHPRAHPTCRSALWPGGDDRRSGALFGARASEAGANHFTSITERGSASCLAGAGGLPRLLLLRALPAFGDIAAVLKRPRSVGNLAA